MKKRILTLALLALVLANCRHDAEIPATPILTFENDIKPIILNGCARSGCHNGSGESPTLTNYEQVMGIVKSGEPHKSKLYKVITKLWSGNMPPEGPLADEQIKNIYIWISQGAKEK